MKLAIKILLLLSVLTGAAAGAQDKAIANNKAVVKTGSARFTVLTAQLVRLEWDSTGAFNNDASFVVINRNLPVPAFTQLVENGWLIIKTKALELRYRENSGKFNKDNLLIKYTKDERHAFTWNPGAKQKDNLKGTARTLDTFSGDTSYQNHQKLQLEDGLLSRDGWYFLDDSKSPLFDHSDWPWVKQRKINDAQDWYFIGYGADYKSALDDFTQIAGKVPLPPRYAFGYWWSRYWKYSDNELRELVGNFDKYHIPLDVLVIDMDWHKKLDQYGWTGWTFDDALFPDHGQFLGWLRDQQLKITLNLHPAGGIAPGEPPYKPFAQKIGFDTSRHQIIPYLGSSKPFMQNLFNVVLHPLEKQGVAFWWLDWQQWANDRAIPALNNTWWLNYAFFTDMERNSADRPMLYHRWGGLGNHRYQIGFSGDTYISWQSLAYQPYFTNTASNVLYDYWSHDIGGHMYAPGQTGFDPELYVRWMQYGALSPIFRTHSSKNAELNKELWNFKGDEFDALTNAVKLRYQLAPYIYTMARKTYDTSIGLCRPLYYDFPESQEAYDFKDEYQFGDDLLVAPIGAPMVDGYSKVKVWLPPGNDWYEWPTGTLLKGGQTIDREFSLLEYPVYIKAGAIIPMYGDIKNLQQNPGKMIIGIFPGGTAATKIYEDSGNSKDYATQYTYTPVTSQLVDRTLKVTILPRTGAFKGMSATNDYAIKLYGSEMPERVLVNGKAVKYAYNGRELAVIIAIPSVKSLAKTEVLVQYSKKVKVDINDGLLEKMKRLTKATNALKHKDADLLIPDVIGSAEETNRSLEYYPDRFYQLIDSFNKNYQAIPAHIKEMNLSKENEIWYLKQLQH